MKRRIFLFLTIILMLTGCELTYKEMKTPAIRMVSLGLDYVNTGITNLPMCPVEQEYVRKQIAYNSSLSDYEYNGIHISQIGNQLKTVKDYNENGALEEKTTYKSISSLYSEHGERAIYSVVKEAIEEIAEIAKPNDITIFYYSGHGDGSEKSDHTYTGEFGSPVFLVDFVADKATDYILTSELLQMISTIPGKKLIIMDSCFSGAATSYKDQPYTDDKAMDILINRSYSYNDNMWVLSASRHYEESTGFYESPSLFTGHMLNYLGSSKKWETGKPEHNEIWLSDILKYTREKINPEIKDTIQYPMGDEFKDLLLFSIK